MIECYFKKCKYHAQKTPFCTKEMCRATTKDLFVWRKEHRKQQAIRSKEASNEH